MAIIPPQSADPTLDAMRQAMEHKASLEPQRTYLGASSIGDECSRKLWYGLNGYKPLPIESKGLMAIQDGHRTEDLMNERLRMVPGIELHTQKENGDQYGFDWGFLSGHYDGVVCGLYQAKKTWHIYEVKCVNEKKFNELKKLIALHGEKEALAKWDPIYFAQAVIYMYAEDLTRHYMAVCTPGGRDVVSCRTESNKKLAESLIEKAKRIHASKEPPEKIGGSDFWVCKWCRFRDTCHA